MVAKTPSTSKALVRPAKAAPKAQLTAPDPPVLQDDEDDGPGDGGMPYVSEDAAEDLRNGGSQVSVLTRTELEGLLQSAMRKALGTVGGIRSGEVRRGEAVHGDSADDVPLPPLARAAIQEAQAFAAAAQKQRAVQKFTAALMQDGQGADSSYVHDLERRVVEAEQRSRDAVSDSRFTALSARMDILSKAAPANGNGHDPSKSVVDALLGGFKAAMELMPRSTPTDPIGAAQGLIEAAKGIADLRSGASPMDLEVQKLRAKLLMWEHEMSAATNAAQRAAEREGALELQSARNLERLVEIGQTALKEAVKPITDAVGDGLRARIAAGGGPPGPAAQGATTVPRLPSGEPDFDKFTPEQEAAFQENLKQLRAAMSSAEERFAESQRRKSAAKSGGPA